jgi:hypothetical protein
MSKTQDVRHYTDGPVTELDYIRVEYGRFEEYVDWLNATWKPTMEAMKRAGLIIAYKVVRATPKTPDQPNIILMITFKDGAAALDKGVEQEEVAKTVIGSTAVQNKAGRAGINTEQCWASNTFVNSFCNKGASAERSWLRFFDHDTVVRRSAM